MTKPELSNGRLGRLIIGCFVALSALAGSDRGGYVFAQQSLQSNQDVSLNDGVPKEVENVTVDQKLGTRIPLNLPLTDSMGRKVKTGYFIDGKKPTIITLNYSSCPMLCSVQLNSLTQSLSELDLQIG